MKPNYAPGRNIAMKVPTHEYEGTVAFYRDVLGFRPVDDPHWSSTESQRFHFGDRILWIDCVPTISQAEVWFEIATDDVAAAAEHLAAHGCARRDGIEPLPADFNGFWVSSPANVIHLVAGSETA